MLALKRVVSSTRPQVHVAGNVICGNSVKGIDVNFGRASCSGFTENKKISL